MIREKQIEENFINRLIELKYTYRQDICDRYTLEFNFRKKFERLNCVNLSDSEFARLLEDITDSDVFVSSKRLRERNTFFREDGTPLQYTLVDIKNWCRNEYEVVNQLRINTHNSFRRYDVILLINGLPLVQIELKALEVSPKRAMQQIVDYKNDAGNGYANSLLCFIQMFIVSNQTNTYYFANNNNQHFNFNADENFLPVYRWADENNRKISGLDAFADAFLPKCKLGEMISRYMVLVASEQKVLMMRPYQIYAVKAISSIITNKDNSSLADNVWSFIEEYLNHLPMFITKYDKIECVIERDMRILYDRVVSYFVQNGLNVPLNAQDFQKGLRERFIERDSMFFTASQALEYEEKKKSANGIIPMALFISSEAEGIEWLKRELQNPQTYSDLQPEWMKNMLPPKKGDVLPELMSILEENFIKDEEGNWRNPDPEKAADLEIIRNRRMMKEFNMYLEQAQKPKAKRMKDTRLEVLRYGFKECYKQKNYQAIVTIGDHILESLLQEDEVLLQYYDIASSRV